jgi:hypothetical protein
MKTAPYLAALVATIGAARAQTTWYVDASGTAPGSGTQADPWVSIDNAVHRPLVRDLLPRRALKHEGS